MSKKKSVGIVFSGQSTSQEMGWQSVRDVVGAIDRKNYRPILIGTDNAGEWHLYDSANIPQPNSTQISQLTPADFNDDIDLIFPIPYAPLGEDKANQTLPRVPNIPFVGSDVVLDKVTTMHKLQGADIPTAAFMTLQANEKPPSYASIKASLGAELVVKPTKPGSLFGVIKVENEAEYDSALEVAFHYDSTILVEQSIRGRVLECAVMGNRHPRASVPGEKCTTGNPFSCHKPFINEKGSAVQIPAKVPLKIISKIQQLAIKVFEVLSCKGVASVEFWLKSNNDIVISKINTMPDFSTSSVYPGLWQASGICYSALINRLLLLALERFDNDKHIGTGREVLS